MRRGVAVARQAWLPIIAVLSTAWCACSLRSLTPRVVGFSSDEVLISLPTRLAEDLHEKVLEFVAFRSRVALCCTSPCPEVVVWGRRGPQRKLDSGTPVTGLKFFPLGDRLLAWSDEDTMATIWDVAAGQVLVRVRHSQPVALARIFPKGDRVLLRSVDGAYTVADAASGAKVSTFQEVVRPLALTMSDDEGAALEVLHSGDAVLTTSGIMWATVWDADSGEERCRFEEHLAPIIVAKAFPFDGRAVSGGYDRVAFVWDAASCRPSARLEVGDWVTGVAVVRRGDVVATSCFDRSVVIWSAVTGDRLHVLQPSAAGEQMWLNGVQSFPLHGRVLSFTWAKAVVWGDDAEAVYRLGDFSSRLRAVSMSPAGDVVVTSHDSGAIAWRGASGERLFSVEGPTPAGGEERQRSCVADVAVSTAMDPQGLGAGASWREIAALGGLAADAHAF